MKIQWACEMRRKDTWQRVAGPGDRGVLSALEQKEALLLLEMENRKLVVIYVKGQGLEGPEMWIETNKLSKVAEQMAWDK